MAGPLTGIRVIELANYMAGPFCGMLLADLGADVIKVEPPGTGDHARHSPPFLGGEAAGFLSLNRNKRSIALNLKAPEGRNAFLRLVRTADVVLENFRPGTLADLDIDATTLRQIQPRLVVCSISGFGQTGPYSQRPGLDLIVQAMSGLMSVTGEPNRPPVKCGVPVADLSTALYASLAIVSALRERDRTGVGETIDLSLFECGMSLLVWESSLYFATGEVPAPLGSAHRASAPYQALRTSDGYVTIGGGAQRLWYAICDVLGLSELKNDPRFATNPDRKKNEAELAMILEEVTRARSTAEWVKRFEEAGVPCGPIQTLDQVIADPQTQARGIVTETDHPTASRHRLLGSPIHFAGSPAGSPRPAPLLGQHSVEILRDAGYTDEEISDLLGRAIAEARTAGIGKTISPSCS